MAADQIRTSFQDPNRGPTPHETPISAAEILRRALVARGGEAAAARIRSYRCQGTADFAWGGRGNFEFLAARPNLSRAIFDFGAGSRFDFAFDGRTAWEARPGLAPETQIGEKLRESRDQAAWFAGYDDPRNYLSVAYVGETLFEGAKCHALKVITQSGLEQTHYYNASNYLLAGMLEQVTVEARPTWCISSFLDYRKVAGFRFPVRYRCRMEESEWVIRLHSIHVNGVKSSDFVPAAAPVPATPDAKAAETLARLPDAEIKTLLRDCIDGDKLGVGLVVGRLDAEGSRIFSYGKLGDDSWVMKAARK